jgi:two-component system, chemotaxis family, protein-glutamate methylesterase/glutaminase
MPHRKFIVVIGTSAGGGTLLPELIKQFRDDMNIAVFLVMHLSKMEVGDMLVARLQNYTSLKCKIASDGEPVQTNHVYIARPDYHLLLKKNRIRLGKGPMENRYRPSIDALFRSAAAEYGSDVIGIILTGMLEDGAAGMLTIKRAGGICIVQDPNEAQFPDMPAAVMNHLKPDYVIPVNKMGLAISEIKNKRMKKRKSKIPADVLKEAEIAERVNIGIEQLSDLGERSLFSCPDCGGGLWEIKTNGESRYRCHVGHAYSEQGLLTGMQLSTESALWTALRIIEERRNLLKNLVAKERKKGLRKVAGTYSKRLEELESQINALKKVLFATESD